MGQAEFNTYCKSLPHATHVVQWGGSDVWKVGGKVFAIGGWDQGQELGITFKVSELAYEILKDQKGCRPAPYLASRGMKWIQRTSAQSMNDKALKDYLRESHLIVSLGLPKKVQSELGLKESDAPAGSKSKPKSKSKSKTPRGKK